MGIIIGGITTTTAFFAVSVSDFRGFRELGLMTGTGIIFGLAAMTLFLPAMLIFFADRPHRRKPTTIAGFGLKTFLSSVESSPRTILILAGILIGGLTVTGFGVMFDDNLRNFRTLDNETLALQDRVKGWLGGSIGSILLVNQGDSEDQVLEADARAYAALQPLQKAGHIAGLKALSQYLPSPLQQRRNLTFIRQHPEHFDISRIQTTFNKAMLKEGFRVDDLYDAYFANLTRGFKSEGILLPSTLPSLGLQDLLKPFFLSSDDRPRTVLYVQPAEDLWLREDVRQFKKMLIQQLSDKGIPDGH
jgi:predicted exporter